MARKSSRSSRPPRPATHAQLQQVRADLQQAMADFTDLAERFDKFSVIHVQRIAQVQAELDEVRSAWLRTVSKRRKRGR